VTELTIVAMEVMKRKSVVATSLVTMFTNFNVITSNVSLDTMFVTVMTIVAMDQMRIT
jgi:hypothetical protein